MSTPRRKLSPALLLALVFIVMAIVGLVLGQLLAGVDLSSAMHLAF